MLRAPHRTTRRLVLAVLLVAGAMATCTAFAASLSVNPDKLTTWHSATSVTCTPGTVTASASADSYIDEQSASSNFGSATLLKVRAQISLLGLVGDARTLVKFTLPAIPDLCTMTQATLRLNAATASGTARTLQALRVNASWAENTVTWNTMPATTGTAATATSGAGWREWTVTSQVAAMYSGSNHGFLIKDSAVLSLLGTFLQEFSSREAASNQPELVITYG